MPRGRTNLVQPLRYLTVTNYWRRIETAVRHLPQVIHRDKDRSRMTLPVIVLEVPYVAPYLDTWPDYHLKFIVLSQGFLDGVP